MLVGFFLELKIHTGVSNRTVKNVGVKIFFEVGSEKQTLPFYSRPR